MNQWRIQDFSDGGVNPQAQRGQIFPKTDFMKMKEIGPGAPLGSSHGNKMVCKWPDALIYFPQICSA